jgi:multicomponent Na+:H+ antiporter subunit E
MKLITWGVFLTLIWASLAGGFWPGTVLMGLVVALLVLSLARMPGSPRQRANILAAARLLPYFLWELLLSNFRVARDVITPRLRMRPGIVAIPLDLTSDAEITWLANLVTLTPGTISIDVSHDRRVLYIHAMDIDDAEQLRQAIKSGFERRVMEVWR